MTDLRTYYDESYPPSLWTPVPVAPRITSLNPNTAVINTPVTVTVTGTDFTADAVVRANSTSLPTTYVSATSLTATYTTPGTAGPVAITVRNSVGTSNQSAFTVTATAEEPQSFAAIPVDRPPNASEEPSV